MAPKTSPNVEIHVDGLTNLEEFEQSATGEDVVREEYQGSTYK